MNHDGATARFRQLYDGEAVRLVGYVARRMANPTAAPDVVADVFTTAWRRLDDVPPGGEARLWLYGVARHTLANWRRGEQRRDRLSSRLRGELRVLATHAATAAQDVLEVRAALERLADDDRELLRLTAWEELTPSEIAAVMELPAGTVRRRLHDARNRLRAELDLSPAERSHDQHVLPRTEQHTEDSR